MRPLLFVFLVACTGTLLPDPEPADEPPAVDVSAQALQRAESTVATLGASLKKSMTEAMQADGPVGAAAFCSTEAQPLTAGTLPAGVQAGRASLKTRNPDNTGPDWVQAWLATQGERKAEGVTGVSRVDTLPDGRVVARVLKPIPVEPPCLVCHGPAESLPPEVSTLLASRYPEDKATGYAVGDLRGAIWAEVPVGAVAPAP
jgi:hypothetical protein